MNEQVNSKMRPDDRLLDQLVDDELDQEERQQVLRALEAEPAGWRRCAMAFLEAQAWRRAMIYMASDRGSAHRARAQVKPSSASIGGHQNPEAMRLRHWLAMAACALVAFALGVGLAPPWQKGNVDPGPAVATMSERGDVGDSTAPAPPGSDPFSRSESELLVSGQPGEWSRGLPEWAQTTRETTEMLEALERRGHQVHRQRGLVPFRLEDGRSAVVPVEDLYVVPVRRSTY
jgi:hypothetical protein